jgi:RNA polymerase sigma-70 factor, ECF subfamily
MNQALKQITQGAFCFALQLVKQSADAQDVVQEAAVAIAHPNAPFISSPEFKAWFYRVARNKALDRLRQIKRQSCDEYDEQVELSGDTMQLSMTENGPESSLQQSRLKGQVAKAMEQLSPMQKEVVLLKDFHQFSYQDIAKVLDMPSGSVMSVLHRGRLTLRDLLQQQWKEHNER